jgi:hypothetical protein
MVLFQFQMDSHDKGGKEAACAAIRKGDTGRRRGCILLQGKNLFHRIK